MTTTPEPDPEPMPPMPVNVTVHPRDGGPVIAAQLEYRGVDHEDIAVWAVIDPPESWPGWDFNPRVLIDVLPGKCGISFPARSR